ncbi:MAG: RNA polymerase sigma factor [Firmicutes bacterium]|nr:RNA polymerase sigma factor [Bacillota bacterium]MCL5014823.1 RNA polymerase sigma factor [Bacillota bacterium]HBQ95209.1 hypothetical protein [Sulfobacillus sp.]
MSDTHLTPEIIKRGNVARMMNDPVSGKSNRFIEDLFVRSRPRLWRMAFNMLNDKTLAEDAVSEIWIRVLSHLPEFREEAKLTTWIYRIAMNTIIDMARSRNRVTSYQWSEVASEPADLREDPDSNCERSLKDAFVHYGLSQLPPPQRSLIIMRDIEDLPIKHIAAILDLPQSAVKSRLHRARRSLKHILQHRTRVPGKEAIGVVSISEGGRLS